MVGNYNRWVEDTDTYPYLREVLSPEYAALQSIELEQMIEEQFPGMSAEALNKQLGSFFRSAGNTLSRAAPGLLQGAVSGAAAGSALGPYGMLAGALGGAALGGFQSHQASLQQPATQQATTPTTASPSLTGVSTSPVSRSPSPVAVTMPAQTVAANSTAAQQLLAILSRPETLQALVSMIMGQIGRRDVSVGNTQVPVAAFSNLVSTVGQRATAEQNQMMSGESLETPAYLMNEAGEFVCDPMDSEQRASVLMNLLDSTKPSASWPVEDQFDEFHEDEMEEQDELDELEELMEQDEDDEAWEEELDEMFG